MRVAFTLIGGGKWTGGRNYLLNLLKILSRYESKRVMPVLFVGMDCSNDDLAPFLQLSNIQIVRASCFDADKNRANLVRALLFGRANDVMAQFFKNNIDVIFEAAQFFGWRIKKPVIAWIPDFQHRILPDLFPWLAKIKREIGFRAQMLSGRIIMLSSNDAKESCEQFYPSSRKKIDVVSFSIAPTAFIKTEQDEAIVRGYGINAPFFFLPNQFWKHKNHCLVIEAMALLRERGQRVLVVASGAQVDARHPDYFQNFNKRIKQLDLTEDFRLLGVIPYEHIGSLMRTSLALLNPSLFEGWSTTVEEARFWGVPMLLSDLKVHKEQMNEGAVYFDRYSPLSLANCLMSFLPLDVAIRQSTFAEAQKQAETRARAYAESFVRVALRCNQESCKSEN